jgi:ADP-heptose:LPS heptosyltransferase
MGDVALLLPALKIVMDQHPDIKITLVTRKKFSVFFQGYPQIEVFSADFEGIHKGFVGLFRLFRELKKLNITHVIDLHQNLRTSVLKTFFALTGIKVQTLDKGRADKKALTRKDNKIREALPHSVARYLEVFRKAGIISSFTVPDHPVKYFVHSDESIKRVDKWLKQINPEKLTGIAPFAQHKAKMWPVDKYKTLIDQLLIQYPGHTFLLFGGGDKEKSILDEIAAKDKRVVNMVGLFSLEDEITLISRLQLMICGDSSNMHLATLNGVKVLSIWGATHTDAGFGPLGQGADHVLEIPVSELSCRPCSVYGNKPCFRGDYACMNWITPEMAAERTAQLI